MFLLVAMACYFNGYSQVTNMCMDFDGGSNSKVSSGDINELDEVSEFTIEFWIYIDQWVDGAKIFNKQGVDWKHRISMSMGQASTKRFYFHVNNGSNTYMAIDNSAIAVGNWHHIAIAYDGNGLAFSQLKFYIDGTEVTNKWFSNSQGLVASQTPSMGSFEIGKNFNGKIDEFRIWNNTLTSNDLELTNTINKHHPLYDNLLVYYRGDQSQISDIVDYTDAYHGGISGNVSKVAVTDNNTFYYNIVMTYLRANQIPRGYLPTYKKEYLQNVNDIIVMGVSPLPDGSIFYDYPDNDGALTNVNYLSSYNGRDGVLEFTGSGSEVNCNKGLFIEKNGDGSKIFTFEAWVYIDQWVQGSKIFIKQGVDWKHKISISLGEESNKRLYFHVSNGTNTYAALDNQISVETWHHIAMAYDGSASAYNQLNITIDGIEKSPWYSASDGKVALSCPDTDDDFIVGQDFNGKIDDIRYWSIFRCPNNVAAWNYRDIPTNSWEYTLLRGYWKINNPANPAKDEKNFTDDFETVNDIYDGMAGVLKRIAFTSGSFKEMMKTDAARRNFASNAKKLCEKVGSDGIDLDFEWCVNATEWSNYSKIILALNDSLPASKIFSVSLHSAYYQISAAAISALDYLSVQIYGPNQALFPYSRWVADYYKFINYGIPANKLVMGMPFYGQTNNSREVGYSNIIASYPNLAPDVDLVQMSVIDQYGTSNGNCVPGNPATYITKDVVLNGVNTIKKKTLFAKENARGVMNWDAATDIAYTDTKCLLRALNSVINANVDSIVTSLTLKSASVKPGINMSEVSSLELYPNPAKGIVHIKTNDAIKSISIFDIVGKKIFAKNYSTYKTNTEKIDVSDFKSGLHIVKVETSDGKNFTTKFLRE